MRTSLTVLAGLLAVALTAGSGALAVTSDVMGPAGGYRVTANGTGPGVAP